MPIRPTKQRKYGNHEFDKFTVIIHMFCGKCRAPFSAPVDKFAFYQADDGRATQNIMEGKRCPICKHMPKE